MWHHNIIISQTNLVGENTVLQLNILATGFHTSGSNQIKSKFISRHITFNKVNCNNLQCTYIMSWGVAWPNYESLVWEHQPSKCFDGEPTIPAVVQFPIFPDHVFPVHVRRHSLSPVSQPITASFPLRLYHACAGGCGSGQPLAGNNTTISNKGTLVLKTGYLLMGTYVVVSNHFKEKLVININ